MILSCIDDATWVETLTGVPEWHPPLRPALVLAPHPDDETLGAGALIATLRRYEVPVTVVAATDGENACDAPSAERLQLGEIRHLEQRDALAVLEVPATRIERLRLTDSGLHAQGRELTAMLMDIAQPEMHLIAPWVGDFHPDHEACARAAKAVAAAKKLSLTSYFFWTWHRGQLCARRDSIAGQSRCVAMPSLTIGTRER